MALPFLTVTAAVLAAAPAAPTDLLQWARNPISGRWVGFVTQPRTWTESEAQATSLLGHLLTVRSLAENDWTLQTFRGLSGNQSWIGLGDAAVEGTFTWTSGEPVTFQFFVAGEPNDAGGTEDGVTIDLMSGGWRDRATTILRTSLVERGAEPTSGWSLPEAHVLPVFTARASWPCDIDGDGRTDLLVVTRNDGVGGGLCPLLQQPDGAFLFGPCSPVASVNADRSAVGDFDADGHVDVVISGFTGLYLYRGLPGSAFGPSIPILTAVNVSSFVAADIDLDGRDELVVAWWLSLTGQSYLSTFRGASAAGFAERVDRPIAQKPSDLDAGDMNNDGFVDFHATGSSSSPSDQTFFGQGTLDLIPGPIFNGATAFVISSLADLDGDFDLDVVYRKQMPDRLWVAWNDGTGVLNTGPVIATTSLNGDLTTADIDGDGIGDVIASEIEGSRVQIVRALGGGAFASPDFLALEGSASFLTAADLRADASPEIVVGVNLLPAAFHVTLLENLTPDCDGNGVDDPRDIERGTGFDENADGALDACQPGGEVFCAGDGSAAACPCAASAPPGAGCANSTGQGGRLRAIGSTSIAFDTLRIEASTLPATSTARLVQGTTGVNGGAGVAFGDGLHCAGGALVRIAQRSASGGTVAWGAGGAGDLPISTRGGVTPGRRVYQVVYRDSTPFCTSAPFNTTNGISVTWTP